MSNHTLTWGDIYAAVKSVASQVSLGGDLTQISLPAVFCLPHTTVQMLALKRFHGMYILEEEVLKAQNPIERFLLIIKWVFSGIVEEEFGKKPLNPVIGETFRCRQGNWVYAGEQVMHHPPITAAYFEHQHLNISLEANAEVIAKFMGNSVAVEIKGFNRIRIDPSGKRVYKPHLKDILPKQKHHAEGHKKKKSKKKHKKNNKHHQHQHNHDEGQKNLRHSQGDDAKVEKQEESTIEEYYFEQGIPKGYARGLLFGEQYYELGGNCGIVCEQTGLRCNIEFKLAKILLGGRNRVRGVLADIATGAELVVFTGEWNSVIKAEGHTKEGRQAVEKLFPNGVLYERAAVAPCDLPIEEFNDSRGGTITTSEDIWGKVRQAIQAGDLEKADVEKFNVESKQRAKRAELAKEGGVHELVFFEHVPGEGYIIKPNHEAFRFSPDYVIPSLANQAK